MGGELLGPDRDCSRNRKPALEAGFRLTELAGLEPATSWVRSRRSRVTRIQLKRPRVFARCSHESRRLRRRAEKTPANTKSRRPDSNRGPLHYEFRAAVTTSHQESPQLTPRAKSAGLVMTHDDWR
jgi:hypothetical protein